MSSEILIKHTRDPLFGFTPPELREHLHDSLRGRCTHAYLYGSFVRGDMSSDSDVDCIVVTETDVPFPQRAGLYDDLRDSLPSLQVLVYTPSEFRDLTTDPSPGFWRSVCREMERIL